MISFRLVQFPKSGLFLIGCLLVCEPLFGQEKIENPISTRLHVEDGKLIGSVVTDPNARVYNRKIPAPRGRLLDRNGRAVLQSKSVGYPAIPLLNDPSFEKIEEDFEAKLESLNQLLAETDAAHVPFKKDRGWAEEYLKTRKWLPMVLPYLLTLEQERKLPKDSFAIIRGHARHYPFGNSALHALGLVGRDRNSLSTSGYVSKKEALFYRFEALFGFEKMFDSTLSGSEGLYTNLFDDEGRDLILEARLNPVKKMPIAGKDVRLSLDIELQQRLESVLSRRKWRGAVVLRSAIEEDDVWVKISYPLLSRMRSRPYISSAEMLRWMNPMRGYAWLNRFEEPLLWLSGKSLLTISKTEEPGAARYVRSLARKEQSMWVESSELKLPRFQGVLWMTSDKGFEDSTLLEALIKEITHYFEVI